MDEALAVVAAYLGQHDPRYLAQDVVLDIVAETRPRIGRPAVAAFVHDVRHRVFTDVDDTVTGLRAVGDHVVAEVTFAGRQCGAIGGLAPTGRRLELRVAVVFTVTDGEIARLRIYHDSASVLRQLRPDSQHQLAGRGA